jgi:hypothetical protein
MKKIVAVVALATLGGCAVYQPGPANYIGRTDAAAFDPYQWHTVEAEPAQVSRYRAAPTYYAQPYYAPQPSYYAPQYYAPQPYYRYPPVTIGLDFMFRGGHGYRGRGGHGRGYRGHGRR